MAGMLLHYLILEHLMVLWHVHMAAWCNNTPTISWTNKLSASHSPVAGCLTCALAMWIHVNGASPLTSLSIASVNNTMADMALWTFHHNMATTETIDINDDDFFHLFNSHFPLQDTLWHSFHLNSKLTSLILFSKLRGAALTLALWWQIIKKGSTIGTIRQTSSHPSITWTPCSPPSPLSSESSSSPLLPNIYVVGTVAKVNRL